MQHRYKKLLELLEHDSISPEEIKTALSCSLEEGNMLFNNLTDMGAVKNGKIISAAKFKKCALHRLVYDTYYTISYNLQQIIKYALIEDDRFIKIIKENLDDRFSLDLSQNSKKHYLEEIFNDDIKAYIIETLACKYLLEMYDEGKGLFLDLYWSNRLRNMLGKL